MKLSIIIPSYNEDETILGIIDKVKEQHIGDVSKEIIVVNDGSTDKTEDLLNKVRGIKLISYKKNSGKGFAIREGLKNATGDIVLIQDADLELSPEDYPALIKPIVEGNYEVVFGSRILGGYKFRKSPFYYGGRLVTFVANVLYGIKITDEPIGYKVFKTRVIKSLNLRCERFEFCPEVTAKIARKKIPIFEVPVRYVPRKKTEGKKLKSWDGFQAIWTLLKYRFKKL